jgi:predicted dithiol-disulfide oxidoreductase (DUF899 family)
MTDHQVVSPEEWQAAWHKLLLREKEHTRASDDLARQRRELPWLAIEKECRFDTADGPRTLAGLFGASYLPEQVGGWDLDIGGLPPIVARNAAATGTDIRGYLSESPAVSAFAVQDGAVYQTYAATARGVEFLMGYYPILDRAPKGRDEGEGMQTWIRRHDEYA